MHSLPNRRECLVAAALAGIPGLISSRYSPFDLGGLVGQHTNRTLPPAHSIIPVVGDGKWIWREPPADQTGLMEPRTYEVRVEISAQAEFAATDLLAVTAAPVPHPEQEILDVQFVRDGCQAELTTLSDGAAQWAVAASHIPAGATIRGEAVFKLRISKSYWGYRRDLFPMEQPISDPIRNSYLKSSPGIELKLNSLERIVAETTQQDEHPWDQAAAFHRWVFENIRGVPGAYTSVRRALETRQGDCEERAGVFIALCRTAGIPARLVWVPQHVWAEFLLVDHDGKPHWIPAHTAAYSWFGWTGAHEVILQKGDRIRQPGPDRDVRLLQDWWRCRGTKPKVSFAASVRPLPSDGAGDPGPGARTKQTDGRWILVGDHPDDKHMRV